MAKTVAIDVKINAESGAKSLKDLKQDLKDLQTQISATKEGSEQYYQTLRKIGQTKDEMEDLRDAIASTTGAGQFQAIANVGSSIAGGFAAAQGAMALFGSESKDLEKTLVKVQAAMAFSQGLKDLEGLGDSLKNVSSVVSNLGGKGVSAIKSLWSAISSGQIITKSVTIAQYAWNAALKANPIMLVVTALAALAAGVAFLMSNEKDENEVLAKSIEARERQIELLKEENDTANFIAQNKINLLKAQGVADKKLFDEEQKLRLQRIEQSKDLSKKLLENLREQQRIAINTVRDGDEEEIKSAMDKFAEINKSLKESNKEQLKTQNEYDVALAQRDTDARKKNKEKAKENADIQKELNAKLAQLRIENIDDERKQALAKENLDYENQVKEYKTKYKGRKELNDLLYELENKHLNSLSEINNKFNIEDQKKEDEKRKKREEAERLERERIEKHNQEMLEGVKRNQAEQISEYETRIKTQQRLGQDSDQLELELAKYKLDTILNDEKSTYEQRIAAQEEYDAKVAEIDKRDKERKEAAVMASLNITKQGLQTTADLVASFAGKSIEAQKKAFEFQKGVNIATAVIDTYQSAVAAYKSALLTPIVGNILAPIAAGVAVAAGIANIRKIEQTTFDAKGVSGGGGGGTGGGGSFAPNLTAPVSSTSTNLASIGFGENKPEPVKVFVTETDISSNVNKVKSIEQKASIE